MAKPGLETDVCLRESQLKFESTDLTFNTIRVSTFSPGFLNRQTILLLDSLGVPMHYFIDLQLDSIKSCSLSTLEKQILAGKLDLQRLGIRCFNDVLKTMAKRRMLTEDPCLKNVMQGMNFSNLQRLKKKARIYLHDSATLIGVVDEDGILEEGEVFVQIRRDSFRCPKSADDATINRIRK
jgi:RNA-dependent RNA polymerase